MVRSLVPLLLVAALLTGCTAAPLGGLVLDPSTRQRVAAGATLDLDAAPVPRGVTWSVDGIVGGTAATGTIDADGVYAAPERLPDGPVDVTVTAADASDATRTASVAVTAYAPGTLYVLEFGGAIAVFEGVDTLDGATAPTRTFALEGGGFLYGGMALAPAADAAFVSTLGPAVGVVRVPNVSTASGTVTDYVALNLGPYGAPSDLTYDDLRDVRYVRASGALLAFDGASAATSLQPAARVVTGAFVDGPNVRLALDVVADRLFLSQTDGTVAVLDGASTASGLTVPDRTIAVDAATVTFTWGLAYDAGRDELYVADQRTGAAIYVIADASTADGATAPSRTLGGAVHPIDRPSEVFYDPLTDRLVALLTGAGVGGVSGYAVWEQASAVDGDVAPGRLVTDATVPIENPTAGHLDPTR